MSITAKDLRSARDLAELRHTGARGAEEAFGVSAEITIDLSVLVANYRKIAATTDAPTAAVVKADAYGMGLSEIAGALLQAGCRDYFVAQLPEAVELRTQIGSGSRIFVLGGLWPGTEQAAHALGIIPVLNSLQQVRAWSDFGRRHSKSLAAAIQIDTGMSRLGLSPEEVVELASDGGLLHPLDVQLILTHLACADTPKHHANLEQLSAFNELRRRLPAAPVSFANSAVAVGEWAPPGGLIRTGIALFGVNPAPENPNRLENAVGLKARVHQIRSIPAGRSVGYGYTYQASARRSIATIALGYADGWRRSLSNRGAAFVDGMRMPMVGRVSMDTFGLDVTEAHALKEGDFVELIGPNQSLEAVAEAAGTIPYEILTGLGRRIVRRFLPANESGSEQ